MRRILVTLAAATLLFALPSVASAHRSSRASDTHTAVYCDPVSTEQGTIIFGADVSQQYGSEAWLIYWEPPAMPDESPPTWYSWQASAELSADGSQLTALFDMYEFVEEPMPEEPIVEAVPPPDPELFVGQATVTASLSPVGEPEPYSYESSDTNVRYRVEGVVQHLAVEGTAALPQGLTFDLGACEALTESYTYFSTNPDAYVSRSEGITAGCYWETEDSFVQVNMYNENDSTGGDLFVADGSGSYYGILDAGLVSESSLYGEFTLYSAGEPEPELAAQAIDTEEPVGNATLEATLTPTGERNQYHDRYGNEKFHLQEETLQVSGELVIVLPGGTMILPMDDANCAASSFRFHTQSSSPSGSPHVKAVPNDLPENALPITVGGSAAIRNTAGTSPEPEAPCTVMDPELNEPVELPIGYTAWWTLTADGEVTVDTAGSDFDTVLGIYVADDEGLTQVACVDDTESLQAAVTFVAEANTTYLIQAGGYGYQTGRLELVVR